VTKNHYSWVTRVMIMAILSTYSGIFLTPAISQDDASQGRTQCIRDCRQRYGSDFLWGGGGTNQQLYYLCLADCDKKFWEEWEKDMDSEKD